MPSLFGALDTAVSGLSSQSAAFSNISDNVANSQTTGFKEIDTSFTDYLTTSTATTNDSGYVDATPDYENNVQGTISASTNPLALAISGNGFFQVSSETTSGQTTTLGTLPEYTRDGNFSLDKNGYLVNDAGEVLNGWAADPTTGVVSQNQVAPIVIDQNGISPVPTSTVTLAANLPATPSSATAVSSQIEVYDAKGTEHAVNLSWTQNAEDDWTVSISAPDATSPSLGTAEVQFGSTVSGNNVPAGTIGNVTNATGNVTASTYAANGAASLTFTADFGDGPQPVTLQLGNYGQSNGVTQYAGTTYNLQSLTQNGVPPGSFSSVSVQSSGAVVVNYDNGQSRTVAQVPLIQFAAPDALQRQDGQAFTATDSSGQPLAQSVGTGGAGTLVTGSLEGSNVDIATEFTKLIVAQQAYSANTKMVTTADQMLEQTINMKQ
jgi:flagellar hook protein FlgE